MDTLEVLDASGHVSVTWDPTNLDEVSNARVEVARLKAAGYSFFAVDPVEDGSGEARADYVPTVTRIEDPVQPPPKGKARSRKVVAVRPMAGG